MNLNNLSERELRHTDGPWYAIEYGGRIVIQKTPNYACNDDLFDLECSPVALQNGALASCAPEMYDLITDLRNALRQTKGDLGQISMDLLKRRLDRVITSVETRKTDLIHEQERTQPKHRRRDS